jgi:phosphoheptose isomerase
MSSNQVLCYFIEDEFNAVEMADISGTAVQSELSSAVKAVRRASWAGKAIFVIGNGGSAEIASQSVTHSLNSSYAFTQFKGVAAFCLNDPSALSGIGADYGYEQVFASWRHMAGRAIT